MERSGNDIKTLIEKVNSIGSLTDQAAVVRAVSDILLILEPVVNKIAPENPIICAATPEQSFGSLRNIATLVNELSYTDKLTLDDEARIQLKAEMKMRILGLCKSDWVKQKYYLCHNCPLP